MLPGTWKRIIRLAVMPNVVAANIATRSGACNSCGACCQGCLFHINDRCSIYNLRPAACRYFPVLPQDVEAAPQCGYTWPNAV